MHIEEAIKLIRMIHQECEMNMDRADKYKKRASEDLHESEENHQDGRWHGNYDILQFIENECKKRGLEV